MSLCHHCDWINFNKTSPADIKPSRGKPSVTDTASQHALLCLCAWTARKNFFPQPHPFRTTNIKMEFHNEYYKIHSPTDLPKLFFFFSDIPNFSMTKAVFDSSHQTSVVTIVIWSSILLLTSELSPILTRANKMQSNSRIIIFCHLCEIEIIKWRWGKIHGYTWTSSKEIYQVDTQTGSKPALTSFPPKQQKAPIEKNMKHCLFFFYFNVLLVIFFL